MHSKGLISYLPFGGGLLPLPRPDGFPVVLGPFGGLGALGAFGAVVLLDMVFPFIKLNVSSSQGRS